MSEHGGCDKPWPSVCLCKEAQQLEGFFGSMSEKKKKEDKEEEAHCGNRANYIKLCFLHFHFSITALKRL